MKSSLVACCTWLHAVLYQYLSVCSTAFYQHVTVYHYCTDGLPFAFKRRACSCGFVFIM